MATSRRRRARRRRCAGGRSAALACRGSTDPDGAESASSEAEGAAGGGGGGGGMSVPPTGCAADDSPSLPCGSARPTDRPTVANEATRHWWPRSTDREPTTGSDRGWPDESATGRCGSRAIILPSSARARCRAALRARLLAWRARVAAPGKCVPSRDDESALTTLAPRTCARGRGPGLRCFRSLRG